ncbi:MAG: hypothetical protein IJZ29_02940 [Clostridia bacterium]|nr:hypothetical protein [Clostridia bacterium]
MPKWCFKCKMDGRNSKMDGRNAKKGGIFQQRREDNRKRENTREYKRRVHERDKREYDSIGLSHEKNRRDKYARVCA